MKKVYIVTSGDYSDYHIDVVFDNKEAAEKLAGVMNKTHNYQEYRVEEHPLNTRSIRPYTWFCRVSDKDGTVVVIEKNEPLITPLSSGRDVQGNYFSYGTSKENAIKNARDYRAQKLYEKSES